MGVTETKHFIVFMFAFRSTGIKFSQRTCTNQMEKDVTHYQAQKELKDKGH